MFCDIIDSVKSFLIVEKLEHLELAENATVKGRRTFGFLFSSSSFFLTFGFLKRLFLHANTCVRAPEPRGLQTPTYYIK